MSRVGLRSRSEAAINRAAAKKVARDEKAAAKKSRLVAKSGNAKGAALVKFGFEADATLPQVVEILKSELTEIQHATSERMKAWAERAAVLVDVFQLKQEQAAAKLGRSQPWVSAVLKWRRDGYKQTAFGPQAKQARLAAPNKPQPPASRDDLTPEQQVHYDKMVAERGPPTPAKPPASDTVVRGPDGKPLDTSGFVGNAKAQLAAEIAKANGTVVEPEEPNLEQAAQQNANKTGRDTMVIHDDGQTTMVHPEPPAEPVAPPRQVTLEDFLKDAVAAEKSVVPAHAVCVRCMEYLLPLMNIPTRQQMRKEFDGYGNKLDRAEKSPTTKKAA
jgi:hypothetical protein